MDNNCFGPTCRGLTTQGFDKANKCQVKTVVREDTEGCEYPFMPTPVFPFLPCYGYTL
jgi:hypothetical protein